MVQFLGSIIRYALGRDAQDWKVEWAQRDLIESGPALHCGVPIRYRPFDTRYTYYTGKSRGFICRPRAETMSHMLAGENLALHVCRQIVSDSWQHVLVTNSVTDDCYVSNRSRERGYTLPLYLYTTQADTQGMLFDLSQLARQPNLSQAFLADVANRTGLAFLSDGNRDMEQCFGPEDVFSYVYAILNSQAYRDRYNEFLSVDFPRIPVTTDKTVFRRLAQLGRKLTDCHLMTRVVGTSVSYPVPGENRVDGGYPKYQPPGEPEPGTGKTLDNGRVYINSNQYFESIEPEEWSFEVGGYQVLDKWLKDRKGRNLSYGEIQHYQRIIAVIRETIRLMHEIDEAIPKWPIE